MNFQQTSISKISKYLCILVILISFIGSLPVFSPYFILKPKYFITNFPKIWIIFTSIFYCDSLFSTFFQCFLIVMSSRIIEPVLGSKEFLFDMNKEIN